MIIDEGRSWNTLLIVIEQIDIVSFWSQCTPTGSFITLMQQRMNSDMTFYIKFCIQF